MQDLQLSCITEIRKYNVQWTIEKMSYSAADPGFPRGTPTPRGEVRFCQIFPKTT